ASRRIRHPGAYRRPAAGGQEEVIELAAGEGVLVATGPGTGGGAAVAAGRVGLGEPASTRAVARVVQRVQPRVARLGVEGPAEHPRAAHAPQDPGDRGDLWLEAALLVRDVRAAHDRRRGTGCPGADAHQPPGLTAARVR